MNVLQFVVFIGLIFMAVFYLLYYLAHLMDWSVRTLSGNRQGIIYELEPVKKE
jgi:hypothetical protein